MSKCVSRRRGMLLSQVAIISIVASVAASCSSDFSRLDDPLVTGALPTSNQRSIITKQSAQPQPYPGNVDPITTASTNSSKSVASSAQKQAAASQPYPEKAGVAGYFAKAFGPPKDDKAVGTVSDVAEGQNENVLSTVNTKQPKTDNITTGSIAPAKTYASASSSVPTTNVDNHKAGWTAIGGTRVKLREGESLHNLSKRYGVPVNEIKRVNNISNANSVRPGQSILIPTYTYSRNAAVSAPDSNPVTKASRSSKGFDGEVSTSRVTVPKSRGTYTAPRQKSVETASVATKAVAHPTKRTQSADTHTVVSGDTLGGIAQKYGVSKNDIKQANGMSSDGVRLGKKLVIPAASSSTRVASLNNGKIKVDPIVTGSTAPITKSSKSKSRNTKPASYTSPKESAEIAKRSAEKGPTPKQTGISTFRWPAKGRVVSKFGSKKNGAANDGIDISVPVGTPVKATENGTVIYAGSDLEEFGKLILVRHAGGWVSAYAHSSKNLVNRGDTVRRGQTIARSGRSGTAQVPKVHFELRKNSNPVNPLNHLKRS